MVSIISLTVKLVSIIIIDIIIGQRHTFFTISSIGVMAFRQCVIIIDSIIGRCRGVLANSIQCHVFLSLKVIITSRQQL